MAKDIVVSGSTFLGVEKIDFATPSGGKATFVDAECNGVILCEVKPAFAYHKHHKANIGGISAQTAVQLNAVSNLSIV